MIARIKIGLWISKDLKSEIDILCKMWWNIYTVLAVCKPEGFFRKRFVSVNDYT